MFDQLHTMYYMKPKNKTASVLQSLPDCFSNLFKVDYKKEIHNSSFNIIQFILSLLDDRHQNLTNQDWNQETNFSGKLFVQIFIT